MKLFLRKFSNERIGLKTVKHCLTNLFNNYLSSGVPKYGRLPMFRSFDSRTRGVIVIFLNKVRSWCNGVYRQKNHTNNDTRLKLHIHLLVFKGVWPQQVEGDGFDPRRRHHKFALMVFKPSLKL